MRRFLAATLLTSAIYASEPCTIVALLEVAPGNEEAFKKSLEHVAQMSRQEASCLEYQVVQDAKEPTKFALYEKWESSEKHQLQFEKPYIKAFIENAMPLLSKPHQGVYGTHLMDNK